MKTLSIKSLFRKRPKSEDALTPHKWTPHIYEIARRPVGGVWLDGIVGGFRFSALVFPAHADNPSWELERTRISKLWIQRLNNDAVVYNWDRGLDIPAEDSETKAVLSCLKVALPAAVAAVD